MKGTLNSNPPTPLTRPCFPISFLLFPHFFPQNFTTNFALKTIFFPHQLFPQPSHHPNHSKPTPNQPNNPCFFQSFPTSSLPTFLPTHSPIHSPTHPLIYPPSHPPTHLITHPLTHSSIHLLTHPSTHPFNHPPTHSPTRPLTYQPPPLLQSFSSHLPFNSLPPLPQVWAPPTPPQDNDYYMESSLLFHYGTTTLPESQLPPIYAKKRKYARVDGLFGGGGVWAGILVFGGRV